MHSLRAKYVPSISRSVGSDLPRHAVARACTQPELSSREGGVADRGVELASPAWCLLLLQPPVGNMGEHASSPLQRPLFGVFCLYVCVAPNDKLACFSFGGLCA